MLHPLNQIAIRNYLSNELRFNDAFSRNSLPRIKDGTYVINLDDRKVKEPIELHYFLTEM